MFGSIKDSWNIVGGSHAIDQFKKRWCKWNINDTIKWFEFTLNTQNVDLINGDNNNDDDFVLKDCSNDSDSSDDEDETDDNYNLKMDGNICDTTLTDFQHVKKLLLAMDFNAKKDLPILVKPF